MCRRASSEFSRHCRENSPDSVWRIFRPRTHRGLGDNLLSTIGEAGVGGGIRTHAARDWKPSGFGAILLHVVRFRSILE